MFDPFLHENLEKIEFPDLCLWSSLYSESIWEKMGFCREIARFNLHETSITQDLIYRFWRLANKRKYPFQLWISKSEKTNGNDIEICINTSSGYLLMPCQAKVLKNSGRYETINHKVGHNGPFQIDLLIRYASHIKGIPIYFLYNYSDDLNFILHLQAKFSIPIQQLGCSIVPAKFIKKRYFAPPLNPFMSPTFQDVHAHYAIPFSELFCNSNRFISNMLSKEVDIHFHSIEELTKSDLWENTAPPASIGRVNTFRDSVSERENFSDDELTFNPRFRIILFHT